MQKSGICIAEQNRGFSLLELLAVTAITLILFGAAIAGYREQLLRVRRAEAHSVLQQTALRQEEYLLRHNHYSDSLDNLGAQGGVLLSRQGYYRVYLNQDPAQCAPVTGNLPDCYLLTARPLGPQRADQHCAELHLRHDGQRSAQNSAALQTSGCW